MKDKHARVLALVRSGVSSSDVLAQMAEITRRNVRDVLIALRDTGHVRCIKGAGGLWAWVPAERALDARLEVAMHVAERRREDWRRENERRRRVRRAEIADEVVASAVASMSPIQRPLSTGDA